MVVNGTWQPPGGMPRWFPDGMGLSSNHPHPNSYIGEPDASILDHQHRFQFDQKNFPNCIGRSFGSRPSGLTRHAIKKLIRECKKKQPVVLLKRLEATLYACVRDRLSRNKKLEKHKKKKRKHEGSSESAVTLHHRTPYRDGMSSADISNISVTSGRDVACGQHFLHNASSETLSEQPFLVIADVRGDAKDLYDAIPEEPMDLSNHAGESKPLSGSHTESRQDLSGHIPSESHYKSSTPNPDTAADSDSESPDAKILDLQLVSHSVVASFYSLLEAIETEVLQSVPEDEVPMTSPRKTLQRAIGSEATAVTKLNQSDPPMSCETFKDSPSQNKSFDSTTPYDSDTENGRLIIDMGQQEDKCANSGRCSPGTLVKAETAAHGVSPSVLPFQTLPKQPISNKRHREGNTADDEDDIPLAERRQKVLAKKVKKVCKQSHPKTKSQKKTAGTPHVASRGPPQSPTFRVPVISETKESLKSKHKQTGKPKNKTKSNVPVSERTSSSRNIFKDSPQTHITMSVAPPPVPFVPGSACGPRPTLSQVRPVQSPPSRIGSLVAKVRQTLQENMKARYKSEAVRQQEPELQASEPSQTETPRKESREKEPNDHQKSPSTVEETSPAKKLDARQEPNVDERITKELPHFNWLEAKLRRSEEGESRKDGTTAKDSEAGPPVVISHLLQTALERNKQDAPDAGTRPLGLTNIPDPAPAPAVLPEPPNPESTVSGLPLEMSTSLNHNDKPCDAPCDKPKTPEVVPIADGAKAMEVTPTEQMTKQATDVAPSNPDNKITKGPLSLPCSIVRSLLLADKTTAASSPTSTQPPALPAPSPLCTVNPPVPKPIATPPQVSESEKAVTIEAPPVCHQPATLPENHAAVTHPPAPSPPSAQQLSVITSHSSTPHQKRQSPPICTTSIIASPNIPPPANFGSVIKPNELEEEVICLGVHSNVVGSPAQKCANRLPPLTQPTIGAVTQQPKLEVSPGVVVYGPQSTSSQAHQMPPGGTCQTPAPVTAESRRVPEVPHTTSQTTVSSPLNLAQNKSSIDEVQKPSAVGNIFLQPMKLPPLSHSGSRQTAAGQHQSLRGALTNTRPITTTVMSAAPSTDTAELASCLSGSLTPPLSPRDELETRRQELRYLNSLAQRRQVEYERLMKLRREKMKILEELEKRYPQYAKTFPSPEQENTKPASGTVNPPVTSTCNAQTAPYKPPNVPSAPNTTPMAPVAPICKTTYPVPPPSLEPPPLHKTTQPKPANAPVTTHFPRTDSVPSTQATAATYSQGVISNVAQLPAISYSQATSRSVSNANSLHNMTYYHNDQSRVAPPQVALCPLPKMQSIPSVPRPPTQNVPVSASNTAAPVNPYVSPHPIAKPAVQCQNPMTPATYMSIPPSKPPHHPICNVQGPRPAPVPMPLNRDTSGYPMPKTWNHLERETYPMQQIPFANFHDSLHKQWSHGDARDVPVTYAAPGSCATMDTRTHQYVQPLMGHGGHQIPPMPGHHTCGYNYPPCLSAVPVQNPSDSMVLQHGKRPYDSTTLGERDSGRAYTDMAQKVTALSNQVQNTAFHAPIRAPAIGYNYMPPHSTTDTTAGRDAHQQMSSRHHNEPTCNKSTPSCPPSGVQTSPEKHRKPDPAKVSHQCSFCHQPAFYVCSGCKRDWYCGQECQKNNWFRHSVVCEKQSISRSHGLKDVNPWTVQAAHKDLAAQQKS